MLDNHDDFGGHAKRNEFQLQRPHARAERRHAEHRVAAHYNLHARGNCCRTSASTSTDLCRRTRRTGTSIDRSGLRDRRSFSTRKRGAWTNWLSAAHRPARRRQPEGAVLRTRRVAAAAGGVPSTRGYLAQMPLSAKAHEDMRRLNGPLARLHARAVVGGKESSACEDELSRISSSTSSKPTNRCCGFTRTRRGKLLRRHRRVAGVVWLADGAARLRRHEPRADAERRARRSAGRTPWSPERRGRRRRRSISRTATRRSRDCSSAG